MQDVLYTVCNPIGNVLRIVIFKRNGIQAMVEYPDSVCGGRGRWSWVVSLDLIPAGLSPFTVLRRPKLP